jgi:ketosteroid isomerase-like protein
MSSHPNLAVIDRMTKAVFENDRTTLAGVFSPDLALHVRGPLPTPGDHVGVDGFLQTIGTIFELTGGDVKIEQLTCLADGQWATEWEHAVMGRNGATLDVNNAFVYRFVDGLIAEMWMICAAPPGGAISNPSSCSTAPSAWCTEPS